MKKYLVLSVLSLAAIGCGSPAPAPKADTAPAVTPADAPATPADKPADAAAPAGDAKPADAPAEAPK